MILIRLGEIHFENKNASQTCSIEKREQPLIAASANLLFVDTSKYYFCNRCTISSISAYISSVSHLFIHQATVGTGHIMSWNMNSLVYNSLISLQLLDYENGNRRHDPKFWKSPVFEHVTIRSLILRLTWLTSSPGLNKTWLSLEMDNLHLYSLGPIRT